MSGSEQTGAADAADDGVLRDLLQPAGRRPQPTAEQLDRWRRQFQTELAAARPRRRRGRAVALAGACAAVVALSVVLTMMLWPWQSPPVPAQTVARVMTAFGGIVVRGGGGRATGLDVDDVIRAGQRVESGLRSGLGVLYGQVDVRLDASTTVVFDDGQLELLAGSIYVDTGAPGGDSAARSDAGGRRGRLQVVTPHGVFSHAGTQFLVTVSGDAVVGAVREGRIVLRHDGAEQVLAAEPERAWMVLVSSDGRMQERAVAPSGELWAWTERASAGISLSGRSAAEVLQWIARERGQRLRYASEAVRRLAESADLAGSGRRLQADQALGVVAAATALRVDDASDPALLTVSLASEGDQDAH